MCVCVYVLYDVECFVVFQVFAFFLGNEKEGELIIGGTDPDHYLHDIR